MDFIVSRPLEWKNIRTTAFKLISSGTFSIQMSVATKRLIGLVIEKIMMSSRLIQISQSRLGGNYLWTAVYTAAFLSLWQRAMIALFAQIVTTSDSSCEDRKRKSMLWEGHTLGVKGAVLYLGNATSVYQCGCVVYTLLSGKHNENVISSKFCMILWACRCGGGW